MAKKKPVVPDATGFEGVPHSVLVAWRDMRPTVPQREPGPEWLSSDQLAQLWKVTPTTARTRLKKLRARGVVIHRSIRDVVDAAGRIYPIPVFRLDP